MDKKELKEQLDSFDSNTSLTAIQEYVKNMIEVRDFPIRKIPKTLCYY